MLTVYPEIKKRGRKYKISRTALLQIIFQLGSTVGIVSQLDTATRELIKVAKIGIDIIRLKISIEITISFLISETITKSQNQSRRLCMEGLESFLDCCINKEIEEEIFYGSLIYLILDCVVCLFCETCSRKDKDLLINSLERTFKKITGFLNNS